MAKKGYMGGGMVGYMYGGKVKGYMDGGCVMASAVSAIEDGISRWLLQVHATLTWT
jgi:hypothetical protein